MTTDEMDDAEAFLWTLCQLQSDSDECIVVNDASRALVRQRDAAIRAAAIREFADHLTGQVFEDNAPLKAILDVAVRFLLLDQPKEAGDG